MQFVVQLWTVLLNSTNTTKNSEVMGEKQTHPPTHLKVVRRDGSVMLFTSSFLQETNMLGQENLACGLQHWNSPTENRHVDSCSGNERKCNETEVTINMHR